MSESLGRRVLDLAREAEEVADLANDQGADQTVRASLTLHYQQISALAAAFPDVDPSETPVNFERLEAALEAEEPEDLGDYF